MQSNGQSARIRAWIYDAFTQQGALDEARVDESLLIRSGTYCGHRFEKDGFRAVWFIEEEQIKLYGKDGQLLRVLDASQLSTDEFLVDNKRAA